MDQRIGLISASVFAMALAAGAIATSPGGLGPLNPVDGVTAVANGISRQDDGDGTSANNHEEDEDEEDEEDEHDEHNERGEHDEHDEHDDDDEFEHRRVPVGTLSQSASNGSHLEGQPSSPASARITGNGKVVSPAAACTIIPACIGTAGSAEFGVTTHYQAGTSIPSGQVRFKLELKRPRAAPPTKEDGGGKDKVDFRAVTLASVAIDRGTAQVRGTGTINGKGNYGFLLTVVDGGVSGGDGVDRFRIAIWDAATGASLYDSGPASPITEGAIAIKG